MYPKGRTNKFSTTHTHTHTPSLHSWSFPSTLSRSAFHFQASLQINLHSRVRALVRFFLFAIYFIIFLKQSCAARKKKTSDRGKPELLLLPLFCLGKRGGPPLLDCMSSPSSIYKSQPNSGPRGRSRDGTRKTGEVSCRTKLQGHGPRFRADGLSRFVCF